MQVLLNIHELEALKLLWTLQKLELTPAIKECLKPFAEEIKTIEFHKFGNLGSITVSIDGKLEDVEYYEVTPLGRYVLDCYEDFSLSDKAAKVYNKIVNHDDGQAVLKIYSDYSEMLTKEDVTGWYAEQFNIADLERNELKQKLATEKEQHGQTSMVLQNYTKILEDNHLL